MNARSRLIPALALCLALAPAGCRKLGSETGSPGGAGAKGDALFLAEAPAVVPDEIEPSLDAMGIKRLFVSAASLSASGQVKPFPPPPSTIKRPTVLVLMGESGASSQLRGAKGEAIAESWANGIQKTIVEAKSWANVKGVHVHILPQPSDAPVLADTFKALKKRFPSISFSVTVPPSADPKSWAPLSGAVDEVLVFTFGKRAETGDTFVPEMTEEAAKAFTVPFRLLFALGGYGQPGSGNEGRRIGDLEIDRLSEDRNLDFDFSQVLSTDPGNIYIFKPRAGFERSQNLLSGAGGKARFAILSFQDAVRLLSASSGWFAKRMLGRVFMVDGVPRDGHLVGYPALEAFLTGKPWEPALKVEAVSGRSTKGATEFSLKVGNVGPTPSELSRFGNFVTVRVDGGAVSAVSAGDFDRFEVLAGDPAGTPSPAPFGRATLCRLYENFFAPFEQNEAGPIRVLGAHPRVFVSYQLTLPNGKVSKGPEVEVALTPPPPEKKAEAPVQRHKKR